MLIDFVIPEAPEYALSKWSDLNMLVNTGGRERTAAEWSEVMASGGFELREIIPTPSPLSIILGYPISMLSSQWPAR